MHKNLSVRIRRKQLSTDNRLYWDKDRPDQPKPKIKMTRDQRWVHLLPQSETTEWVVEDGTYVRWVTRYK